MAFFIVPMAQKYKYSDELVNVMGGSDVIIDVLKKKGVLGFIDKKLGARSARAEYSYGDAIVMWFVAVCRGARRLEHLYSHKESFIRHPRFNKFMSPDTLSYIFKELSVENKYIKKAIPQKRKGQPLKKLEDNIDISKSALYNEINCNDKMNDLLLDMAINLGLLKKGVYYTLDYDTTTIETKIRGSRKYYNGDGKKGYAPALALINNIPLVIENRNGDSNPAFNLTTTIEGILDLLKEKGILVNVVRVDRAGYIKAFTTSMQDRGIKYFTRPKSEVVDSNVGGVFNWKKVSFAKYDAIVGDTLFDFSGHEARMIIQDRGEEKMWGLLTNDMNISNADVVKTYNIRGDSENLFKYLKGDFCWELMPQRELKYNCVYLCVEAICFCIFTYIKRLFATKIKSVRSNMMLYNFIQNFMRIPTRWEEDELVFLNQLKDYTALSGFT